MLQEVSYVLGGEKKKKKPKIITVAMIHLLKSFLDSRKVLVYFIYLHSSTSSPGV